MTAALDKTKVVSHEEWVEARRSFLAKEKEFTRMRDELSRLRRELPWEKVEKQYTFEGADGTETLTDLFDGRNQLVVYHFMLGPGWKEGCPSCSFLADSFDGAIVHMAQRDTSFAAISRATLPEIEVFKKRMGWRFKWVSSFGTDFNFDYQVSASQEEQATGKAYYNYAVGQFPSEERPGASVFLKQGDEIFHTYSTYARGLDMFLPAYHWLDITAKGRDEAEMKPHAMSWVRHHDRYSDKKLVGIGTPRKAV